jgi:hypothetical protein
MVILREFDGTGFTGRETEPRLITFVTDYEQKPGYVVFELGMVF